MEAEDGIISLTRCISKAAVRNEAAAILIAKPLSASSRSYASNAREVWYYSEPVTMEFDN
jgi:hypothetical protein